jgi:hypothetical protein
MRVRVLFVILALVLAMSANATDIDDFYLRHEEGDIAMKRLDADEAAAAEYQYGNICMTSKGNLGVSVHIGPCYRLNMTSATNLIDTYMAIFNLTTTSHDLVMANEKLICALEKEGVYVEFHERMRKFGITVVLLGALCGWLFYTTIQQAHLIKKLARDKSS